MSDRELMEMAAKAAGITVKRSRLDDPMHSDFLIANSPRNSTSIYGAWNPLTDDGDALRLAVKLRLRVATPTCDTDCAVAGCGDVRGVHVKEYSREIAGPYAATRQAITRAAAEIGRAMA